MAEMRKRRLRADEEALGEPTAKPPFVHLARG
jgi:hypothetical protein